MTGTTFSKTISLWMVFRTTCSLCLRRTFQRVDTLNSIREPRHCEGWCYKTHALRRTAFLELVAFHLLEKNLLDAVESSSLGTQFPWRYSMSWDFSKTTVGSDGIGWLTTYVNGAGASVLAGPPKVPGQLLLWHCCWNALLVTQDLYGTSGDTILKVSLPNVHLFSTSTALL